MQQTCQKPSELQILDGVTVIQGYQNFGIAEGKPWVSKGKQGCNLEENISQGIYPTIYNREEKFPEGESLDDLSQRTKKALEDVVLPYVWQADKSGIVDVHVAIVSHGLFIKECLMSLFKMDCGEQSLPFEALSGLRNTGWTRIVVKTKVTIMMLYLNN